MKSLEILNQSLNLTGCNRRKFIGSLGLGLIGTSVLGQVMDENATPVKTLPDERAKVSLPNKGLYEPSEKRKEEVPNPINPNKRIGYAIVGLGNLALAEVLPAFGQCKYSKPVALVSGDPEKAKKIAEQYGISEKSIYNYTNFDEIKNNKEIDVVYIILPNSMHHEFTIRAAKAGKHVLCEKPMANSVKECEEMIDACKKANKKLMVAYRIQYEPNNKQAMKWTREKKYGKVKLIESSNVHNAGDPKQWRLKKALAGGGALPDIGIYCINTIRYLLGEEPESVTGTVYSTPGDERFKEVEETVLFQMQFPGGTLASCITSYGVHTSRRYRAYADKGAWFGMDPAFDYRGLNLEVSEAGENGEIKQHPKLAEKNHFALEMDHFSSCIMSDKKPFTPGEEGLQDQKIIEAIYKAAKENKPVKLEKITGTDVFRGEKPEES